MKERVVIVGAGVSGLALAWKMSEAGTPVVVLEAEDVVGGLARTAREDGYGLDVGPHSFFSEDRAVAETMLSLFDIPLKPAPRTVKFFFKGKYLDYPLTPFNVLFQMGLGEGMRSVASFARGRLFGRAGAPVTGDDETVEAWAINSFGEHLYRAFFKPYTEQFWKVACTELSSRAIPTHTRMSFLNTCRVLLHRKVSRLDPSLVEREMLPTYYPDTGFGEIAERMAAAVKLAGGEVFTGSRVTEIALQPGGTARVTYVRDGTVADVDASQVVSTIPVGDLVKMITPAAPADVLAAADRLEYRPLVVLGMVTEAQDILGVNYMYVMNKPYNRISEMNRFSPRTSPAGENILCVEIPCLRDGAAWQASKEELFDMCAASLAEDGFLGPGDVKRLLLVRAPHAYPVYRKDYAQHLERLLAYLGSCRGVSTLGRTGEFMYMDMDECLRRAFDLAQHIDGTARDRYREES